MRMFALATLLLLAPAQDRPRAPVDLIVGEVTATSALLQARLAGAEEGWLRFTITEGDAARARLLDPVRVDVRTGSIARVRVDELRAGTRYGFSVRGGHDVDALGEARAGSFRTLAGAGARVATRFAIVTGLNQAKFEQSYAGPDKALGYPGLASLLAARLDFLVFTGDSVYYDHPREGRARTLEEMRAKWRRQLAQPRFQELLRAVPSYWMKDDHDHRFNDCDTTGDSPPTSPLGIAVFREQVPVIGPHDHDAPTWRTHRVSRDLQLWLVEGRDHRSPNADPDGPGKTLWGAEQRAWLERTLRASDATFRVLVSPTPLVGPDDAYKRDNHTNPRGFRAEGEAFLAWAREHGLPDAGFVVCCGDRHWQYLSVHPSGVQEFSCGALVDANARLGRAPGDPASTDPEATIRQPYVSRVASGGFLLVDVTPTDEGAAMRLAFVDEHGAELHAATLER
jgi:alkaline phosphatase/alkaline phosphatase D